MPWELLIVGLQCQQSKADNIFQKILDNFDISIFLTKSMYQQIEASSKIKGRLVAKGLVASRSQEWLLKIWPVSSPATQTQAFQNHSIEKHKNLTITLRTTCLCILIYLRCVCVCLMMFLNGVFDYFCFIIIWCHVCLLQTFKCFLLWCFESRLGLRPKEWTMPARIIEAKACACWIISSIKTSDVVFVCFS